jgi:hypothetical protein
MPPRRGRSCGTKCKGGSLSPDKHKMNRPGRRSLPSWTIWLMTCASKPWSWTSETQQEGTTEEIHGSPAESEVFHGNQQRQ